MLCARVLLLALSLPLLGPTALGAAEKGRYAGTGAQSLTINGFSIKVFRHPRAEEDKFLDECIAEVKDKVGKRIFSDEDHGLLILPISGADINGSGEQDAVIEGYTGGADCCWDYGIVSLGKQPGLLAHLYNERGAAFTRMEDGRIVIETLDGRFDYFDSLSHASSVFPQVFLRLRGKQLEEVNGEFWPAYEKEISDAKRNLNKQELDRFRLNFSLKGSRDQNPYEDTRQKVLAIVLAYLYAGKPTEAWQALKDMWPSADKTRITKANPENTRKWSCQASGLVPISED